MFGLLFQRLVLVCKHYDIPQVQNTSSPMSTHCPQQDSYSSYCAIAPLSAGSPLPYHAANIMLGVLHLWPILFPIPTVTFIFHDKKHIYSLLHKVSVENVCPNTIL